MATTAWLYATTASGAASPTNATGAPNGTTADIAAATLTLGGFGIQTAIGAQPASIDSVQVAVTMRGSASSETLPAGAVKVNGVSLNPATTITSSLATYTWTVSPVPTWAALGTLSITITEGSGQTGYSVDAVGVQVTYTTSVSYPAAGTVAAVSAVTGSAHVLASASGTVTAVSAVAGSAQVLPGGASGTVTAVSSVTGSAQVLAAASGTVAASSGVTGSAQVLASASGTVSVVSTVTGSFETVEITIIRAPARTVPQLIRGSHRREDHVVILTGEHAGETLPLVGGDLTLDDTADVHATGTLKLPPELWLRDLLDPVRARTELQVVLAIHGDDGTLHTWPKAVVHPTEEPIEVSADGGLSLSVSVADRSDWVKKAGMRGPYAGLGSLSILTHALRLIGGRAPWLPVGDIDDPGYRSGTDLLVGGLGDDPWQHAVQLAWSVGRRLYVDADGRLSTRSMLTAGSAEARWVAGEADCLVSSMNTSRSDADLCNVLGVPWEEAKPEDADDTWVPRSGVAWWEDTESTFGTQGVLGERVRAYSGDTSIVHSEAHALDLAVSHGIAQQGVLAPLDFAVGCDPRLSVGSTVAVRRPELDVDALCRIGVLRYELASPLMAGSMTERRLLA